jgi:hypothetical protein
MTPKLDAALRAIGDALRELPLKELEELENLLSLGVEFARIEVRKKRNRSAAARKAAETRAKQRAGLMRPSRV